MTAPVPDPTTLSGRVERHRRPDGHGPAQAAPISWRVELYDLSDGPCGPSSIGRCLRSLCT
jgi:hypothetical protein